MYDDRGRERDEKNHSCDHLIRPGNLARNLASIPADKCAHRKRNDNANVSGEEIFQPIVIVAIRVVRAGQRQIIPVRPIKSEGHAHQ